MLRHIFSNLSGKKEFLTFEDRKLLELFVKDTDGFIKEFVIPNKYLFIDEFNYAPKGGKLLKYIIDTQETKIFISGSSSVDLSIQAVKYLTGRIFIFTLHQFDWEEISKKITFEEYSLYGGYPRVVLSKTAEEKQLVVKNIYNTYFLREVKDILGLTDDYKLSQMIKGLALQIGNLVEYQEVGNISELSFRTVKSYANFLEKTFICRFVKPFFKNKRVEIVKNPKVYFFDTGLRNYIVEDFRKLDSREDKGALLENAFAMELIKHDVKFNFWRSKKQAEVDFIVSRGNRRYQGYEIKYKIGDKDKDSISLRSFRHQYPRIPVRMLDYALLNKELKTIL